MCVETNHKPMLLKFKRYLNMLFRYIQIMNMMFLYGIYVQVFGHSNAIFAAYNPMANGTCGDPGSCGFCAKVFQLSEFSNANIVYIYI